jgi:hypothetical protein
VAGAIHSIGGRIGAHMLLWVSPWDSVVRPWGYNLYGHDSESHGGTHHVAPKAAVELKAQAEAMFNMRCFVLC